MSLRPILGFILLAAGIFLIATPSKQEPTVEEMENELKDAVEEQNFEYAAELRDKIKAVNDNSAGKVAMKKDANKANVSASN